MVQKKEKQKNFTHITHSCAECIFRADGLFSEHTEYAKINLLVQNWNYFKPVQNTIYQKLFLVRRAKISVIRYISCDEIVYVWIYKVPSPQKN